MHLRSPARTNFRK